MPTPVFNIPPQIQKIPCFHIQGNILNMRLFYFFFCKEWEDKQILSRKSLPPGRTYVMTHCASPKSHSPWQAQHSSCPAVQHSPAVTNLYREQYRADKSAQRTTDGAFLSQGTNRTNTRLTTSFRFNFYSLLGGLQQIPDKFFKFKS